jgi:sensor c-di-GMP phosphodiesterase-like protein
VKAIWSKRRRFLVGAVGLVLVGAPVVGAQIVLARYLDDQAHGAVLRSAAELVERAETAIDSGLTALTELALAGVSGCGEHDLDQMRRAVYSNFWIKDVGVSGPDGQILCNHIGDPIAVRKVSRPFRSRNENVTLELVEIGAAGRPGVMLVWSFNERGGLSAIVPSGAITSTVLPRGIRENARGTVSLSDGGVIGSFSPIDPAPASADDTLVSARVESSRYPVVAELSAPSEVLASGNLLSYAMFGGILVSSLICGLLVYMLRGPSVLLARISEAAARGEFVPYYQPIVDIGSGRLVGCEVLMRWLKPDGSVGTPDQFIQLAEDSGLAGPMTLGLMRIVRHDLNEVFGERPSLKISINLFNRHFSSLRTVRDIHQIFRGSRIAYSQLVFELTERQPLGDIQRARVVIRRLQKLGARVALDDAGAGHAGLAYLQQLPVDVVKIDKLFVDTITPDGRASPIVDSLIRLGHDLGMEVVAEGVETFDQLDYLRARGADHAQGYLFAPPLPAGAFIDLVVRMEPARPRATIDLEAPVAGAPGRSLAAGMA